jgi:TatA/E family protein of Tat protein translocase
MTISFGQILVILLVIFLFFGNLSAFVKDLAESIKTFQKSLKDKSKD